MSYEYFLGIIGYGNMGSAIAEAWERSAILVFDKNCNKTVGLSGHITVGRDIPDVVKKAEWIFIAVKPQDLDEVLGAMKGLIRDNLIISIVAGVPIGYIEGVLGNIKVLRVMPNLPIRVKEGMFCISLGRYVPKGGEGLHYLTDPFYLMGDVLIVEERMMNAATAVSGSGPGFFYALVSGKDLTYAKRFAKKEFFPALYKAAEAVGFSKLDARQLARVTTEGSLKYLEKSGLDAERLKEQVASKGGTTEAGLEVLNKGGSLEEAVKAALRRAQDLAKRS